MILCLGMKSDLTSRNSSLHVSNAQLQSENNEYKVSVKLPVIKFEDCH